MPIDITEIVVALIGVLTTILTVVIIPWIRTKTGEKRWEQLMLVTYTAVHAAEQMANAGLLQNGLSKLDYATARIIETLEKLKITFDQATIRAAIEAIVLDLKKDK